MSAWRYQMCVFILTNANKHFSILHVVVHDLYIDCCIIYSGGKKKNSDSFIYYSCHIHKLNDQSATSCYFRQNVYGTFTWLMLNVYIQSMWCGRKWIFQFTTVSSRFIIDKVYKDNPISLIKSCKISKQLIHKVTCLRPDQGYYDFLAACPQNVWYHTMHTYCWRCNKCSSYSSECPGQLQN